MKQFFKKHKTASVYAAVTLFVFVFGKVYTHFGHGVVSPYMSLAFLFPLLGTVLYLLFVDCPIPYPTLSTSRAFAYFVTTETLNFIVLGILDIAGAFSNVEGLMGTVAVGFAFAAVALYLDNLKNHKNTKGNKS